MASRREKTPAPARMQAYLDWNASAPVRAEVALAVAASLASCGNPSSVHRWGRAARQCVERARVQVAALVGATPAEIIFTSGGTEANHLALACGAGRRVLISAIEHDSVREALPEATIIPVTPDGIVDLTALETLLDSDARPALVSLMLANNETGAIQPVGAATKIVHRKGALLHCDAVQAAGKMAIDRDGLGPDLMTLSAHKIGGPQGVGALVVRASVALEAVQRGGGQERGRRAGTENVPGIVGFGLAAELAARGLDRYADCARLRDDAGRRLQEIAPDARVFAGTVPRLANTLSIAMPGVPAATQIIALDLAGVMVSAGAACSSGKVGPSRVLAAMGASPEDARNAIRISLGWTTSAAEIDRLVEAWGALYRRSRARAA